MWLKLHTEKYLEQELERLDATNTIMVRSIPSLLRNRRHAHFRRDDTDERSSILGFIKSQDNIYAYYCCANGSPSHTEARNYLGYVGC